MNNGREHVGYDPKAFDPIKPGDTVLIVGTEYECNCVGSSQTMVDMIGKEFQVQGLYGDNDKWILVNGWWWPRCSLWKL